MDEEKKTLKFQMMMSPSEAQELDDWMFENRIRSRAEAIRRLCQIGMAFDRHSPEMFASRAGLMANLAEAINTFADGKSNNPDKLPDVPAAKSTFNSLKNALSLQMRVGLLDQFATLLKNGKDMESALSQAKEMERLLDEAIKDMSAGKRVRLEVTKDGELKRVDKED
ncbi:hypothetical protein [Brucella intermedia]|uniref:hypothetical protein n=1 Tax=Brucella intermedia TaxID=94625 RepID=UPI00124C82A4|nr:hypothetical protein [Brucella intermedia]KAB2733604.1 hypothetical protein F9L02_01095 [Brucella intermedia]